jgi:ribosome-associated protein
MLKIAANLELDEREISFKFIRSSGPGGQNVNKVATAVLLRFNINNSPSLSHAIKMRLKRLAGTKVSTDGELAIKATTHRTQERNKQDALDRLYDLLRRASIAPKKRRKTKPTKSSIERRISTKKLRGKSKSLRSGKIANHD